MSRARMLLALTALVVVFAGSAHADPGDCRLIRGADTTDDATDDVSVCRQDVWFHQAGTKAGNAAALDMDTFPSWNTTKPTASVQSGAGGGYAAASAFSQNVSRSDPRGAATFRGSFTGNLDNIAATLYLFSPVRQASVDQAVWMQLTIDDEVVYQSSAADRTPLTSGGNAVLKTHFAFVNIYDAMQSLGLDTSPEKAHSIELKITGWFSVNDNAVYVYDTTEVPSGLVFNLETAPLNSITAKFDADA